MGGLTPLWSLVTDQARQISVRLTLYLHVLYDELMYVFGWYNTRYATRYSKSYEHPCFYVRPQSTKTNSSRWIRGWEGSAAPDVERGVHVTAHAVDPMQSRSGWAGCLVKYALHSILVRSIHRYLRRRLKRYIISHQYSRIPVYLTVLTYESGTLQNSKVRLSYVPTCFGYSIDPKGRTTHTHPHTQK